jgi:signal transduction histidine kinase
VFRLLRQRTLRTQLALLYAGAFVVLGVALLAVTGLLVGRGSTSASGGTSHQSFFAGRHFQVGPALAFAGAALVALAVGWLIAGRLLRPLRTITATARDISVSNLNQRLALAGRDDEFSELGETLDGLFGRLEASFESQRHFVANASHELRTPLAAERTLLQVALADPDASAESLRATCVQVLALGDQQERLIDALLTLASSERGVDEWQPLDLAEITGTVLLARQQDAQDRGIRVSATLAAAPATGDPGLAECLVSNLVDNAIRHNLDGGVIDISTTTADGLAILSVTNTGPDIPPAEVGRLFEPFQRLGTERVRTADRGGHADAHARRQAPGQAVGYGLGLAIVRAIAGVHNATLAAHARPDGGLTVELSFPGTRQPALNSSPANSAD